MTVQTSLSWNVILETNGARWSHTSRRTRTSASQCSTTSRIARASPAAASAHVSGVSGVFWFSQWTNFATSRACDPATSCSAARVVHQVNVPTPVLLTDLDRLRIRSDESGVDERDVVRNPVPKDDDVPRLELVSDCDGQLLVVGKALSLPPLSIPAERRYLAGLEVHERVAEKGGRSCRQGPSPRCQRG